MLSNLKTTALVAVMGLGLSACANLYDSAKDAAPEGDSFSQALYKNLIMLADSERREEDWADANYFGGLALAAASGNPAEPQSLSERDLVDPHLGELAAARQDLIVAVYGNGGMETSPEAAAMAVAGFECWMQEAEENIQPDDIAACKDMFNEGMAGITGAPAPAPAPMMVDGGPWTVYFGFDESVVDGNGQAPISAAAENALKASDAPLVVTGHADTSGAAQYNLNLSAKRAEAVVEVLGLLGVDASRINVSASGEEDLAVETGDGVREARNRRVEIRLLK